MTVKAYLEEKSRIVFLLYMILVKETFFVIEIERVEGNGSGK